MRSDPVIKNPKPNIDNRVLSPLQQSILAFLAAKWQPIGDRIGHLPRTGDVVHGVSRRRDKAGFASVSRALARLERAGLINAYVPGLQTRGKGYHWAMRR